MQAAASSGPSELCIWTVRQHLIVWCGHIPLATWFEEQCIWIKYCSYSSWWNKNGNKNGERIIWFNISKTKQDQGSCSCVFKIKALVACSGFIPRALARRALLSWRIQIPLIHTSRTESVLRSIYCAVHHTEESRVCHPKICLLGYWFYVAF